MRVWVTRDEPVGGPLGMALEAAGLVAVSEPVVERIPFQDFDTSDIEHLARNDWVVLTSPYAIELLSVLTHHREFRVAVVGEASRRVAERAGFDVAHVSSRGDAASLFEELRWIVRAGRVCYPRSRQARELGDWPGVEVRCPVLYETNARDFDRSVIDHVEIVSVTSPSAVRAIGHLAKPFASIGPSTTDALSHIGVVPVVEAAARSFESLAEAIAHYANDSRHQRA